MKLTEVKLNFTNLNAIDALVQSCLEGTVRAVHEDLQQSQTMPLDTGELQDKSTFIDISKLRKGEAGIVSDTPYARRLYHHPEYNFNQENNPHAGGEWFEPYISGVKKDYAQKVFEHLMKKGMSKIK